MPGYSTDAQRLAAEALALEVHARYGSPPEEIRVVRSPYRVCPLGAHVDHQLGRVCGMALDRSVLLAFAPSGSRETRISSLDFPGEVRFEVGVPCPPALRDWGDYARGAAQALGQQHVLCAGIHGVIQGSLPAVGASSSAAVGVAYLLALERANGLEIGPEENVTLDAFIENSYVGLQNGILDPSVILLSRRGALLDLDCRTRRHEAVPFGGDPSTFRILLVHSGMRRALISTDYNRHVAECREAAAVLLRAAGLPVPDVPLLGIVPPVVFAENGASLPEGLRRRAAHFFGEIRRVHDGVRAWSEGSLERFGCLMNASCESSIHNYRCGSPELITLFEILGSLDGVHGTRFSGAGYGGCCLALVDPAHEERISRVTEERYLTAFPSRRDGFETFSCMPSGGAEVL